MNDIKPPAVKVTGLSKRFQRRDGQRLNAVDEVDLSVSEGEFVVLLGPSGCGKTTLLRCIAGLEKPDSGLIEIQGDVQYDGSRRFSVPVESRGLSMVFQSYALWPHMTVFDNVAFPLRNQKVPRAEIERRVLGALKKVGIPNLGSSYPGQISGGQQQRVALARALVPNGGVILFDEPLSNVDARVRDELRFELLEMQREIGFAAIYVTHDQEEAMTMADRIVVLGGGKIQQIASPEDLYTKPTSRYVARFVGTTNELSGNVVSCSPGGEVKVSTPIGVVVGHVEQGTNFERDEEVIVIWRPENVRITTGTIAPNEINTWTGRVEANVFVGSHREAIFEVGSERVRAYTMGSKLPPDGDEAFISVGPEDVNVLRAD